jgi:GPH family glycoside/pentoside/hexuronide:cation symporter
MVPDTIEYDTAKSGERKEGAYYGMWTFISKLGAALAVFVSGIILSLGGYIANAEQGPGALIAIRIIVGPLPSLILLGAMFLIQFYSLDESTYKKLMNLKKD